MADFLTNHVTMVYVVYFSYSWFIILKFVVILYNFVVIYVKMCNKCVCSNVKCIIIGKSWKRSIEIEAELCTCAVYFLKRSHKNY